MFISVSAHLSSFDASALEAVQQDFSHEYIIDPTQIKSRLLHINVHKSSGPGGLPSWLLRDLAPLLSQPLAAIFNASLREGYQFGCRKSRSTMHAHIAILHTWMTAVDSHGSVRTVFVDFRKAFDLVDHNILFIKLSKYNIPNFLLLCFASYLTNRQQRVRVNSSVSTFKNLKGAMPQGSWLGPLAFLVLIDDLSTGCRLHKYVGDTTLSELVQPKPIWQTYSLGQLTVV